MHEAVWLIALSVGGPWASQVLNWSFRAHKLCLLGTTWDLLCIAHDLHTLIIYLGIIGLKTRLHATMPVSPAQVKTSTFNLDKVEKSNHVNDSSAAIG